MRVCARMCVCGVHVRVVFACMRACVHVRVNITVWKQIHGELSGNVGKMLECLQLPQ